MKRFTQHPFSRTVTIDDRYIVFALDHLYRDAMQAFERSTLLPDARIVARMLQTPPRAVPLEGYYGIDAALTEYFRLMRALQDVPESRERDVAALPAFRRLWSVASSPIFGRPIREGLLPKGVDPLSQALDDLKPSWMITALVPAARASALASDDCSLVGLAARMEDAVALTAVRESVVLYAQVMTLGVPPPPIFEWHVTPDFTAHANRFVREFNNLVGGRLPDVAPEHAALFHAATRRPLDIEGRCVRIGQNPYSTPARHYHWAVCKGTDETLQVEEFWSDEVWTTDRYRSSSPRLGPSRPT